MVNIINKEFRFPHKNDLVKISEGIGVIIGEEKAFYTINIHGKIYEKKITEISILSSGVYEQVLREELLREP